MSIMGAQRLILNGRTAANNTNPANAPLLAYIDPLVTGNDLNKAAEIENDCIGAFTDMHVHGERLDTPRWQKRVAKKKLLLLDNIAELDAILIPFVGKKTDVVTEEMIAEARAKWKAYAVESQEEKDLKKITQEELDWKKKVTAANKAGDWDAAAEAALSQNALRMDRLVTASKLADQRVAIKEKLKKEASELGKKRTRLNKLAAQCEGDALIHYKSNAQLLKVVQTMKGLGSIKKLDDDVLQAHKKKHPVMAAILKYHKLSKEIGTYGDAWAKTWVTHPCKEEGWLNPGDGRLHCVFNPFDAETGRSSSEKPNGQNLPQDKEVRQCFIADPPDENVRISRCPKCGPVECVQIWGNVADPELEGKWRCNCRMGWELHDTDPEEWVLVTADMAGAELRILAELAGDPVWIEAFKRNEDIHSVCAEMEFTAQWLAGQEDGCDYFKTNSATGLPAHQKCKCTVHKELRNKAKAPNFLIVYGGGPGKLAGELGISVDAASEIMALHEANFPSIWAYLLKSGTSAKMTKKAFDLFGGRRLFPKPTTERAIEWCKDRKEEKLRLPEWEQEKNIAAYILRHGTKPKGEDLYGITHRNPTQKEINSGLGALAGSIERQGKNHCVQGTNARIAKIAFGSGFDDNGKPFLWHLLPQWKARFVKFVHDEIVISCPRRFSQQVAAAVQDCIKRAAALKMKSVVMESDYSIGDTWQK
jgi:DNA polymerase I-like protein with 3'-5' exonuclease and polymerase domains